MPRISIPLQFILSLQLGILVTMLSSLATAQIRPPNYDEALTGKLDLANVLASESGVPITHADQWPGQRAYLVKLLATEEFGFGPQQPVTVRFEVFEQGDLLDGKAVRKQIAVFIKRADGKSDKELRVDLLIYMPKNSTKPVPCFLGLNFRGNHGTWDDPSIRLTENWVTKDEGVVDNRATEAARKSTAFRYPVDRLVERGYAVATAYYGDIDPDFDDNFENGIHALFPEHRPDEAHPDRWGSIAAWAWGLSRLADVVEKLPEIDAKKIMVIGHSRLGKTAFWAGATDERFRIVYSNNSGCGGAALSKRVFGESVARINTSFPHWFCRNFRKYNDREESLTFDQHQLIAAIAPRPVYIASATKDQWADPKGEYLSGWFASPAYALLGLKGLPGPEMPEVGKSVGEYVGYHIREGEHALLPFDWEHYMDFADRHLAK